MCERIRLDVDSIWAVLVGDGTNVEGKGGIRRMNSRRGVELVPRVSNDSGVGFISIGETLAMG